MNYEQNLKVIAQMLGDSAYEEDADLRAILPTAILVAEDRILRDLDLLTTRITNDSGLLTQNRREFILPTDQGTFIVLEVLRPIVDGIFGQPLLPTSRETIDMLWPSEQAPSQPSIPQYWAPINQATVIVGPPPDQNYKMQCFGTIRPPTLDPKSVDGTFLSTQLPDLFLAAQLAWLSGGWLKNWSPQADDAASAAGWDGQYKTLVSPSLVEELRKKLQSNGWNSRLPSPIATPAQS